jgi:hypothetical protein
MSGGAYESGLLNLRDQAMGHRGLANNRHRLHRSAIKMHVVNYPARQYSGRFSVVALLARLWRPF